MAPPCRRLLPSSCFHHRSLHADALPSSCGLHSPGRPTNEPHAIFHGKAMTLAIADSRTYELAATLHCKQAAPEAMTYVDALYGGPRDALHCKQAAHEAMNLHSSILLIMFKHCVKRDLYCHHLPQLMFTVPSFPARLQWPCRPCADSTFGARGGTAVQGLHGYVF